MKFRTHASNPKISLYNAKRIEAIENLEMLTKVQREIQNYPGAPATEFFREFTVLKIKKKPNS
ncbi:hypothetical protein, partial [Paenibacillus glucanolyticus]